MCTNKLHENWLLKCEKGCSYDIKRIFTLNRMVLDDFNN